MRLWHEQLIPDLPRPQLLGQHRECCALRGLGWKKKHATVDYVFTHSPYKLYQYHMLVIEEMQRRGYKNDPLWEAPPYRGKACPPYDLADMKVERLTNPIYPEHDTAYLKECKNNLLEKGIRLSYE